MNSSTSSTKRNSSIELLRIILLVCIMLEHVNMWFIPTSSHSTGEWLARSFVQSVCIGSVDAFVLISGWFGIRARVDRIMSLLFQLLFVTIPFLALFIAIGQIEITDLMSLRGIYEYVFGSNNYWFIFCYIGLVIMSPVLNAAVETLSAKTLRTVLCASYVFVLLFDFVFRSDSTGISGGYSLIWFAFLYLLSRYARLYGLPLVQKHDLLLMTICILLQTLLFWKGMIGMRYTNPLVLMPALCAVYAFSKRRFYNKAVNVMASASLMAYMLHMEPCIVMPLRRILTHEYYECGYALYMLKALAGIVATFLVAVGYNRVQQSAWRVIDKVGKQYFHRW